MEPGCQKLGLLKFSKSHFGPWKVLFLPFDPWFRLNALMNFDACAYRIALGLKNGPFSLAEAIFFHTVVKRLEIRLPDGADLLLGVSYWTQDKFKVLGYQRLPWTLEIMLCGVQGTLCIGSHWSLSHLQRCPWSIDTAGL